MRDAFGGAFMIRLLLVFIIIYVGFTAIALNYAKAFKVKNKIIEYLEDNEITDINELTSREYDRMNEFFETEILGKMNYQIGNIECSVPKGYDPDDVEPYCPPDIGIKIVKIHPKESKKNKDGDYFQVYTYFGWEIPFINSILNLSGRNGTVVGGRWEIVGETRTIVNE